jgi:hypothetical protein
LAHDGSVPTTLARDADTESRFHDPVTDWHVFEVAKDGRGRVSLKTIATPLKDHKDAHHTQCAMQ